MPHLRSLTSVPRLMILVLALTVPAVAEARGFRGVAWGASKAEVRQSEKLPLHHDVEDEIAYWNFDFAGVEAGLIYEFEQDRLVRAYFMSRHRTANPEEDHADYLAFQRQLDEHFGPHLDETWVWADGEEHGEDQQSLAAVASGRAKLVSRWKIEGASITLEMVGEDRAIQTLRAYFEPVE